MNIEVDCDEEDLLFAFFNSIYKPTSFIITPNRSPSEWVIPLNDEVLTTALLDKLLYL